MVASRLVETKSGVCVSTVSTSVVLFSDLRKDGLIASRPITADGTDGADGTDVIFTTRAQLDHSGPCAAFTRECDLDAQRPEECLRPPQPTSQRPRIFCPCRGPRDVIASTLRTKTQKVRRAPGPHGPVDHDCMVPRNRS
jgi:hypothetical protein